MAAVAAGVLMATLQYAPSQSAADAPMIKQVTTPAEQSFPQTDMIVNSIASLQAQLDALRLELAAVQQEQVAQTVHQTDIDHAPAIQPALHDPITDTQLSLRAAEDEQEVFERRLASDVPDMAFGDALEASLHQVAIEFADTELSGFALTELDCRALGCELRIELGNPGQAAAMPLLIESQLEGQARVRTVTAHGERQLRIVIERA